MTGEIIKCVALLVAGLVIGSNLGVILMCLLQIQPLQARFEVLAECHDEHYRDMLALMEENGILWEILAKFIDPEEVKCLRQAMQERSYPHVDDPDCE